MNRKFERLMTLGNVYRKPLFDYEKSAQDAGMPPAVGQSPVVGNPDEMQAPESASQRQFEDDFGSLAYQFVTDRAPALVPYMLGFEVVDRNEDGSKAVGIFGYKVDDDLYYIPAFFLNNQVRGVDMILNKKTNQFVPLTEKWINFIVNKHSIRIGSPASDEVRDTMRNPDLSFVQRPQVALGTIGKTASSEQVWTPSEAWEHIKEATAALVENDADFSEMLSGAVGELPAEKCAESRYIKDFMESVGGPECMSSLLGAMHDVGFANAALTLYKGAEAFWTDNLSGASIHVDRMRKAAEARPKVRIVDSTSGLNKESEDSSPKSEDSALSAEENARQIVEHDFTIEDDRPDEDVAKVTDDKVLVDFEHRFSPPGEAGRYNFMMSDGLSRPGTLMNVVVSPSYNKGMSIVCFDDGDGIILAEASTKSMITTEFEGDSSSFGPGKGFAELFNKAVPFSDIEIESVGHDYDPIYLFVDDKGNAAGPFCLRTVIADGDHVMLSTAFCASCDSRIVTSEPSSLEPGYGFMDWNMSDVYHSFDGEGRKGDCCTSNCDSGTMISIGSFSGIAKKTSFGVLVPHDWKALKIKKPDRWPRYEEGQSEAQHEKARAEAARRYDEMCAKYTFASPMDVLSSMRSEGIERIKVASDGVEFTVAVDGAKRRHGPMNYKAAAVDLVTRFGFRPRRAFSTLAKAASDRSVMLLVRVPSLAKEGLTQKQAQDGLVNVAMPSPLEQLPSIDQYSGVPVYTSPYVDMTQGQFTGVPGLPPEGGLTRGINVGGEMERSMGSGDYPDEHTDAMKGALPIDEEARRLAEDAAKAGQRHVFDQAAIGGLVKVFDTANVIDSYIPDFMDTIDRLGRVLFLFYWRHEDFSQRYGSDDIVQMEDRLRNVFKQLGELTLNLKEKSVQKD